MAVAENGIFEVARNRYSKCYRFQDINYTTATEDEQIGIFERYLTITIERKNFEETKAQFATLEASRALFIKKYPSSLSERFINEITSLPVHTITSIDVVPVPKDLTTKTLQKKYLDIESDIIKQQRVRNKNNDFSTEISYAERTEKKEIEAIMDDVRENDQCLFYVGVTIIVMAERKKELDSICETIETIGKRNSCTIDTHY